MAGVDTSIYAQQQRQDPLATVGSTIGIANAFTQRQLLQNELQQSQLGLQGTQGVADTYNDPAILNPDGTVNPARVNNLLVKHNAGVAIPGAMSTNTSIAGGQISNEGANSGVIQAQQGQALAAANAVAANPGATRNDILGSLTGKLHSGQLSPKAYTELVSQMPAGDKAAVQYIKTRSAGTAPAADQAAPATAGFNPDTLQPIVKTGADVAAAARSPAGTVLTPAPGAIDVASSDKKALFEDQLKASNTMAGLRPLQQTLPLLQQLNHFNFGPGSAEFAKLKGALTTAGAIDPNTSDLQVRQEVNKKLLQYATQAGSAGRSDHALSAALGSNPNLDLTQPANLALVKNQIGIDRMDAAVPKAAAFDRKGSQSYSDYKSGFYQENDPRAFSLDVMTPEERDATYKSLGKPGSAAYNKFAHSYDIAKKAGMLSPEGVVQ